ncbi:YwiC-like family protein [Actinotalea solisilvae]|uniref:YwiC-like family protein n=1 Tax=Actinotalea solisilvae TaxID=2072922 RepID=UPI0018F1D718|nr:YwiC-like family protein [Actinotalea solisilvae]
MVTAVPTRARGRRRRGPGWVPNQHGAWAMLVLPAVVGAAHAGVRWWHLVLLAAWLSAYLAYFAVGLWLKSRRRPRYLPPVRAYAATTAVLGALVVVGEPAVLRWGLVYAPLLATSLVLVARRADRTVTNDLVMVAAASLLAVVAHAGAVPTGAGPAWLPGGGDPHGWVLAGVLLAYFAGTVPYVKTMIRARGDRRMYAASVALHGALAAGAGAWAVAAAAGGLGDLRLAVWLTVLAVLLAVRAAVVPRRWPAATPKQVGLGEIAASAALALVLLLA